MPIFQMRKQAQREKLIPGESDIMLLQHSPLPTTVCLKSIRSVGSLTVPPWRYRGPQEAWVLGLAFKKSGS